MPGDFTSGSESSFDMAGAVNEIAEGLGFGGETDPDERDTPAPDDNIDKGGDTGDKGALLDGEADPTPSPAPTPPSPEMDLTQPPKTWRKEFGETWATLPEGIRGEIHRREADMYRGLEQYREGAQFGWEVQGLFKPYEAVMTQLQVTPAQVIPGLVNAHARLSFGSDGEKLSLIGQLIKDYAIPVPQLLADLTGGALDGTDTFVTPEVKALQEELKGLKSRIAEQDTRALTAQRKELEASITKFAEDPKNIYFAELADDIAALIRGGVTRDLQVAYEKALWANPAVRAKEQARIAAESEAERSRKAREAAERARKATSANVRSTARSGGPTAANSTSIDETLARTLAEINSRS